MPKVSIILVHYRETQVLYDCIKSIYASKPKTSLEIIVVDNDEIKKIKQYLKKHFDKVVYVPAPKNVGYGNGNNLGAKMAHGDYLLVLNPDTIIHKNTIDELYKFVSSKKNVGIVAPTLLNNRGIPYPLQGTRTLTPLRGVFALSFLNKIFPNNPISKKYWLRDINRASPYQVDVVPGSAFMIRNSLFKKIGGFDKNFFLYFEEFDLCKRVIDLGYKLFIIPKAKLTHFWAVSTPPSEKISKIFAQSRFYYFKKNYGIISAVIVEFSARINKWNIAFLLILILGTFLRFYRLEQNLIFNGEMGYDYLTIKGYLDKGEIPLIGPRTSHEWFFIGPLFYWIFGILLSITKWSVLSGAVFMAVIGGVSVVFCYLAIRDLFGQKVGIISSYLLAISPLWISLAREARFNSITSLLFFPFLYHLVKSIQNGGKDLFLLGFILGVMFSFFPSPILLLPSTFAVLFVYMDKLVKKNLLNGLIGLTIPLVPYLIYNATHNFEILLNLAKWIPYRILGFLGLYPKNNASSEVIASNVTGLYSFFQESWIWQNNILVLILFISVGIFILKTKKTLELKVLLLIFIVSYIGLFVHGSPPKHYYLVMFPVPIIFLSILIEKLVERSRVFVFIILAGVSLINFKYYFSDKWFYIDNKKVSDDGYYVPFELQKAVAKHIVYEAKGKAVKIQRVGKYDNFEEDFSLNYQYLIKISGGIVDNNSGLVFTIYEDTSRIPGEETIVLISNLVVSKKYEDLNSK